MTYMQDYGKPYFSSQYEEKYLILCNKDKTADNTKLISWEFVSFISVATMKVHQLETLLVWAQIHKLEICVFIKWPDCFTVYILINHSKEEHWYNY